MNFGSLDAFIKDARRLGELQGNSGRKITRWLEKNSKDGMFDLMISKVSIDGKPVSVMEFAWDLRKVQAGCNLASMDLNQRGFVVGFSVDKVNPKEITAVIHIEPESIPVSMKQRQKLLEFIASSLDSLKGIVTQNAATEEEILSDMVPDNRYDEGGVEELDLAAIEKDKISFRTAFYSLVEGDTRGILDIPLSLTSLASTINPKVISDAAEAEVALDERNAFLRRHGL